MTIHRRMFDKTCNNKGDTKMQNENENGPEESTESGTEATAAPEPTPVEVEEVSQEEDKEKSIEGFREDMIAALMQRAHEEEMDQMRAMGLYGNIDEDKAQETVNALIVLWESSKVKMPDGSELLKPFDFFISTNGGSADDMFAIYDLMSVVKDSGVDIGTIGIGKVMSAGVLLLAAGTKGKRRIGKNCRVMIHSVIGGQHGSLHNLENEMDEIRQVSDMYMRALVSETNLSHSRIKTLLDRKVNIYLSAEEAIEYGIADYIYGEDGDK